MDELDEKVLDISQRQKRAQIMRRYKSKIERSREMAKKRMAPEASIRKRAFVQARQIIRRRVAGARGAEYEKLGPSEKIAIDRAVEGKQKAIKKLALRLIPRVKQAEAKRLHSFMKGQQIQNQGQPEGKSKEASGSSSVKESLNNLFQEAFPPTDTSTALGQKVDNPVGTADGKKMPPKGKSKSSEIVIHNKFQEEVEYDTPAFTALFKKSEKSGIDLEILGEVYNRGWNSWTEGLKVTQEQYAFARVNSYINQGKTYFNEDSDLHELSTKTLKSYLKKTADVAKSNYHWQGGFIVNKIPSHKAKNRKQGRLDALDRIMQRDEETQIDEMGGDQHYGDTKGAFSKGAKGTPITPEKMKKDTSKALNQLFQKAMKKEEVGLDELSKDTMKRYKDDATWDRDYERGAEDDKTRQKREKGIQLAKKKLEEGRAPGTPSIKRYTRPDGTTALKSLNKWGKRKDWRDTEGGLAKAKEHAGVDKVTEEVQQTNENFMDGKGPGKPGDSARHGLKGKSASELRKIRSSETASPRKKQLAHWLLNMHHNEETELDEKRGLWDNIHAKRRRIKAGSGERMRKPGSKGAPTAQDFKDASESVVESYDVNSKHYKALTDLDLNTKNRDMTTKHDGYGPLNPLDKKGSKAFWEDKAKMWNTTTKAAMEARCRNCAAFNQAPAIMKKMAEGLGPAGHKIQDLANLGFCELFEFKCAGDRTCNKWLVNGPITEEDTGNGTKLVDKESKNSKARKKLEVVDRKPPHTEYTRQAEIKHKIIDEKACPICNGNGCKCKGNVQNDPKKREIGTDSLVKAYKADTPFSENLDESFNIAFAAGVGVTLTAADLGMKAKGGFAYHPSVVEEIDEVEEEVRSADYKGVIVRTADGKTVVRKQKVDRKIIKSGNVHDGEPDDTV